VALFRYDDPDFGAPYDLDTTDAPATALLEVTALAWNSEFTADAVPMAKYTTTDPHIIAMAARFARQIS
jgi:hypothetical protein